MRQPPKVSGWCPLFEWLPDGKGNCTQYGVHPYTLQACCSWPTHPDQIVAYPDCTFTFNWVDD